MTGKDDLDRFKDLTFDDFRAMASDTSLSRHEKIGFPDDYRRGHELSILEDIRSKLPSLDRPGAIAVDIGCGCGDLAELMMGHRSDRGVELVLVDSQEMLAQLPGSELETRYPGRFPDCPEVLERYGGRVDAVIVYSVLHSVFIDASIFDFLDAACLLLKDGGEILIGDIPNVSKRKRFLSSPAGAAFHKDFTGRDEEPEVHFIQLERRLIDDGVVMGIIARYRGFGFDAYLLPQAVGLPMSNRREDILIRKP
jgi:hypothetical protein